MEEKMEEERKNRWIQEISEETKSVPTEAGNNEIQDCFVEAEGDSHRWTIPDCLTSAQMRQI